jgi:two-component system phosphate regulon response regulator PhoB
VADEGEWALVPERNAVRVGGQEVLLTPTQYRLLALLLGEPGRIFSRAELVERGIGELVEPRTVDVHIKEIRRKLGPHRERIVTVKNRGYRYVAP